MQTEETFRMRVEAAPRSQVQLPEASTPLLLPPGESKQTVTVTCRPSPRLTCNVKWPEVFAVYSGLTRMDRDDKY